MSSWHLPGAMLNDYVLMVSSLFSRRSLSALQNDTIQRKRTPVSAAFAVMHGWLLDPSIAGSSALSWHE
eukprot:53717-Pyramimonas_sp.AAC.1